MASKKVEAKLYELVGEWKALWDLVSDPDMDEETILDTAEAIEGTIEVKADGYGQIIRMIDMEATGLKARAKYLKDAAKAIDDHAKALNNKSDRLKERLMEGMIAVDHDELKTDNFTFKVQGKGGVQPLVIDGDVPESYMKVILEPDNDKIREFLKENTCDWCHLAPRGKRLDIK